MSKNAFAIDEITIGSQSLRVGIRKAGCDQPPLDQPPLGQPPLNQPPLLILNGLGANMELLTPFVKAWPEMTMLTFDVPGTGGSPTPMMPYRLPHLADMAVRLLDHYGYERADVLGISWGGVLAQQLAVQHPDYCRRLVLCCTSAGAFMVPGRPRTLLRMVSARRYRDPAYLAEQACVLYGGRFCDPNNKTAQGHAQRIKPPSGRGYYLQMLAALGWTSIHWLHRLRMPVMIMAGQKDPIVPLINARILNWAIPESTLKTYDCGHLFMLTCLDETTADLKLFLSPTHASR